MSSAPPSRPWNVHRLPSAEGRVFLVTGGNAGIGYFVAEQLAVAGAVVVLGSRDTAKADAAMASIRSRVSGAHVRHLQLDLADLSSLKTAVDRLDVEHLDAAVYNAGVALDDPPRRETEDGHELMFGTNHLGHFALTQWLAPLLSAAAGRPHRDRGKLRSTVRATGPEQFAVDQGLSAQAHLRPIEAGADVLRLRTRSPPTRSRQHGAQRGGPSRRRVGLPHPVPPAGTHDIPRPTAARLARRTHGAGQGRWSMAGCPCSPRLGGGGRATLGAEDLRAAWHTTA